MNIPADLIPGDILLYGGMGIFDSAIGVVEGDDADHIEVYAGEILGMPQSWASRNGIGVDLYPFRPDSLKYVRRCKTTLNEEMAQKWFLAGVKGIKYGWGDILANVEPDEFGNASTNLTKCDGVDCSHFAAALLQVGQCGQFDETFPKNKIRPRDFKLSVNSIQIWP